MKPKKTSWVAATLLVLYAGSYLLIRGGSMARAKGAMGKSGRGSVVFLGATQRDFNLWMGAAFSGDEQEKLQARRVRSRMLAIGMFYAPMRWADESLTGSDIYTAFEQLTP